MTDGERRAGPTTWPWWTGFFVTVAIALRLSYLAYQELLPEAFRSFDKVVHCTVAGMLAFFLDGALGRRALPLGGRSLPLAPVGLLTLFGVEEFMQRFSVHRTSDFADYAADVVGVVLFTWLSRRVGRRSESSGADPAHDRAE